MNDIFGEENFIAQITVLTNPKGRVLSKHFAESHDYLLVYSRNAEVAEFSVEKPEEQILKEYMEHDQDGRYRTLELRNTHRQFGAHNRKHLFYPLYVMPITENDGIVSFECKDDAIQIEPIWDNGFRGCWTWGQIKARSNCHLLVARKTAGNWKIYRKSYAIDSAGKNARKKLKTVWLESAFHTEKGQSAFDAVMPQGLFQSPKPVGLIQALIDVSASDDDVIVDFFAGSGTTAEAVLQLNKEDGGNRKFILVQLPEQINNHEFRNIAEITRERVRGVIHRMNNSDGEKLPLDGEVTPDRGYKAFRLAASNFKIWEGTAGEEDADAIATQLELFSDNLLPDATPENILFEIMLKAGYDLNARREEIRIAGHSVYSIDNGQHLICLERDITRETIDGMIEHKPVGVICLDEAFHGDDSLLTNTLLQMQDAGIVFQTI